MKFLFCKIRYKIVELLITISYKINYNLKIKQIKYKSAFQKSCKHKETRIALHAFSEHVVKTRKCLICDQILNVNNEWK